MEKIQSPILTVGSLAFDSIRAPAGKADSVLGGSVNYFSVAASFFNPVQVVAVVGEDFPDSHLEWLSFRQIDVSGIEKAEGKTFHWVGEYGQDLSEAKTLSTALNVFEHFKPQLSDQHKKASHIFLANIDPSLQMAVLDQVENPELVVLDTMNFWITGQPEEVKKTLKKIDILSINEGEAYLLSNQKNITSAAETIRDMGPSVVIIKRGEYGAALFTQTGTFLAPAFPVNNVVDPTGAGDSFAGAFMGYLAKQKVTRLLSKEDPQAWDTELRKAIVYGCVMASFTVEDFSLHRLMHLEEAELHAREKSLIKMITI
jgi:sugar/nucleoside kinase (ribokinase family)